MLTASGCNAAGYSLNGGELATIKNNRLITDRATLTGPGPSTTRVRLQTLFATASSAFTSAAVTTALAGERISSAQRDAIISGNFESYKLWNYYKRLIDALT